MLAASKMRSADEVREAYGAGIRVFGENYVVELSAKAPTLPQAEWHLIGHLQRNKVPKVVGTAALVQSLDSVRLADELDRAARLRGVVQPVLLEVNVAGEASKSGLALAEVHSLARQVASLSALELRGLMTMPPPRGDPRPFYDTARDLRDGLAEMLGRPLPVLSFGMSDEIGRAHV